MAGAAWIQHRQGSTIRTDRRHSTAWRQGPPNPARWGLAALSAGLVWLCLPSGPAPWLPLLALTPFALALRGAGPGQGLALGWASGAAFWLASSWWVSRGLAGMADWGPAAAWTGTAVLCLYEGLPYALLGLAAGWLQRRGRRAGPLFCAALLTLLVALRPVLCPGSPVLALYSWPLAIQTADLGGVHLVFFLMLLTNWLLADALARLRRPGMAALELAGLALLLACVLGYGAWRLQQLQGQAHEAGPDRFITVTTVQPDLPVKGYKGIDRSGPYAGPRGAMLRLSERAAAAHPGADLLVWPEVPQDIPCACGELPPGPAERAARAVGAPVLVTCVELDYGANQPVTKLRHLPDGSSVQETSRHIAAMYNAARLVRPDGTCGEVYRKVMLVPFAERSALPGQKWIQEMMGRSIYYSAGQGPRLLTLPHGKRVQPLICFESGFSNLVRRGTAMGADALVNVSDDAWFGSAKAAELHLALALFRAVEVRRPLVRCTNSGLGAHIRASGEIVPGTLTPAWKPGFFFARLYCPQGLTPFARWGDIWLWAAAALVLARLLLALAGKKPVDRAGRHVLA